MNTLYRGQRTRHVVVGMIACLLFAAAPHVPAWAQIRQQPQVIFGSPQVASSDLVLPQVPRDLRRALQRAEESVKAKQYGEAVESLIEILNGPDAQDYFLPANFGLAPDGLEDGANAENRLKQDRSGPRTRRGSLKQRALELLGNLPPAGREAYERQVGDEAQRTLDGAISAGDVEELTRVSRQYFHTTAGYEATMLLARLELDQRRPLAAVGHLHRLQRAPVAMQRHANEIVVMLGFCWQLAGKDAALRSTVDQYQGQLAGAAVTLAGKEQRLPNSASDQLAWFHTALGAQPLKIQIGGGKEWTLFGGNARRNGETRGGMPLGTCEWEFESAFDWNDEKLIASAYEYFMDKGQPAIPVAQPLAVGDQLVVRTPRVIYGVDLTTGARIWPYPEESLDTVETESEPKRRYTSSVFSLPHQSDPTQTLLNQRTWQDAAYAHISSDGERLFLLRDLSPPDPTAAVLRMRQFRFNQAETPEAPFNRMVALEIATQGKTLWSDGGPDSQDARLEDAYFLGCPLPVEGHLYAIAEMKDEIQLLSLDPENGELEWAQALVQVESLLPIDADPVRRLAGASPSFADGVLVCPTSSGAVIGVDLSSRSLLWAYALQHKSGHDIARQRFPIDPGVMGAPGDHWADSVAMIDNGHVILTPLESDRLYCLDLFTGDLSWPSKLRDGMLYVACSYDDKVIVVEEHGIRSMRLDDGQPAWPAIRLKENEFPSGRGFRSGPHYYLPTSRSELLKIDLDQGEIADRQPTERVLGNLVCHGDYLVSQSPASVVAYPLRSRRRSSVMPRLKASPNDPDTLEDYANLLASEGNLREAVEVMEKAVANRSNASLKRESQKALVSLLLISLQVDFENHLSYLDRVPKLAPTPEQTRQLHEIAADGLAELGRYDDAFERYLQLIHTVIVQAGKSHEFSMLPTTQPSDESWRVSEAIQFADRMAEMLEQVDDAALPIDSLAETMNLNSSDWNGSQLRMWFHCLSLLAEGDYDPPTKSQVQLLFDQSRLAATKRLLEESQWLPATLMLDQPGGSQAIQFQCCAAVAIAAQENHDVTIADQYYSRLASQWPGESMDGKDGKQRYAAFQAQLSPADQRLIQEFQWPTGKIETKKEDVQALRFNQPQYDIPWRGVLPEWLQGSRLVFDARSSNIILNDRFGQTTHEINVGQIETPNYAALTAAARGRLLCISFGSELLAIDLLKDEVADDVPVLWRKRLFDEIVLNSTNRVVLDRQHKRLHFEQITKVIGPFGEIGQIGPISEFGVCIIRNGHLECLDLLTGEIRWARRNLQGQHELFGTETRVALCRSANGETRILDMADGKELGVVRLPQGSRHWDSFGRYLLTEEGHYESGRDLQIRVWDVETGETIWKRSVQGKSKAKVIEREELAVIEPDGTFTISRIRDGQQILKTQLEREPAKLMALEVIRSQHAYLIVTSRDDQARYHELQRTGLHIQSVSAMGYQRQRPISGHIYSLDRKSGELTWEKPLSVSQYSLVDQAPDVPLMIFARRINRHLARASGQGKLLSSIDLTMIDPRTGGAVLQESLPLSGTQYCQVSVNRAKHQLDFSLAPHVRYVVQFTDQPPTAVVTPSLQEVPMGDPEANKKTSGAKNIQQLLRKRANGQWNDKGVDPNDATPEKEEIDPDDAKKKPEAGPLDDLFDP